MEHVINVLVVGAGIIGNAIAYHLRKRDIDIAVLEREEQGE
jgi:L-2-hydroxyglutarate oxidase LhgO